MKHKEDISRVKLEGETVEDLEEMAEVFNNYFCSVFTKANEFKEERISTVNRISLGEVETTVEEI
ncbi:hypothetical protein E2C01_050915 [Portunus trituberculatus]|uniref:Uncharacterized protein n=1 Tax=Portunus trituberculatus TaxID=210409 RepID=A0A5B7GI70_PORTR|nr:hypothetical protein [Portunus trituberculatus]